MPQHRVYLYDVAQPDAYNCRPTTIKVRCSTRLRAVGVGAGVGHGEAALASVLQLEVLVGKLGAIDGLTTRAIAGGEVTTLQPASDPAHSLIRINFYKSQIRGVSATATSQRKRGSHELRDDAVEAAALVGQSLSGAASALLACTHDRQSDPDSKVDTIRKT